jgi:hypothetical protein
MTPERERHRRVTWPEVDIYVELVADFYRRHGRDANEDETDELVAQAREMVASGTSSKQVH